MIEKDISSNKNTPRENFLMGILHKVINEYKSLLDETRRTKPLKVLEISRLSTVPGESEFLINITHKRCVLRLSAAQIIQEGYDLNDFNEFQANMIKYAAQGKLIEFLKITEKEPSYHIVSKKFEKEIGQYCFTLKTPNNLHIKRTIEELVSNKDLLQNLSLDDIYDIAYTQGSESILKEKTALMLAKQS